LRSLSKAGQVLPAIWPACVGALSVLYASAGDGAWTRRSAIAWMTASWGARLSVQALYTRAAGLPAFELPLLTSYFRLLTFSLLFALPALFASLNREPSLSALEIGASVLWVVAFAGETTADRQLLRFRSEPAHVGVVCRSGIWRLVPQAHAVFETLIWTALALFALASPWGWVAVACPAAMLYLLTRRY
jgi:steroid 5-alpha reductase family enzyme